MRINASLGPLNRNDVVARPTAMIPADCELRTLRVTGRIVAAGAWGDGAGLTRWRSARAGKADRSTAGAIGVEEVGIGIGLVERAG